MNLGHKNILKFVFLIRISVALVFLLCNVLDARHVTRDVTNPASSINLRTICDFEIPRNNTTPKPQSHNLSVPCEKISNHSRFDIGDCLTCYLQETKLNLPGITVSSPKDDKVEGLELWKNKNALFLPREIGLKFPNLKVYHAHSCAIQAIHYNNFKGLKSLTRLYLSRNQIEKIEFGTFDDLVSLEVLTLCKYRACLRLESFS